MEETDVMLQRLSKQVLELSSNMNSLKDGIIDDLTRKLKYFEEDLNSYKGTIEKLKIKLDGFVNDVSTECDTLKSDMSHVKNKLENIPTFAKLLESFDGRLAKLDSFTFNNSEDVRRDILNVNSKIGVLTSQIEIINNSFRDTKIVNEEIQKQFNETAQSMLMHNRHLTNELSSMKDNIRTLESEVLNKISGADMSPLVLRDARISIVKDNQITVTLKDDNDEDSVTLICYEDVIHLR